MEKIKFYDQASNEEVELFVIEQTKFQGDTYLIATEEEDGDSDAYIMKEVSDKENELFYEMVEDDEILNALSKIFEELLEDVDIL